MQPIKIQSTKAYILGLTMTNGNASTLIVMNCLRICLNALSATLGAESNAAKEKGGESKRVIWLKDLSGFLCSEALQHTFSFCCIPVSAPQTLV